MSGETPPPLLPVPLTHETHVLVQLRLDAFHGGARQRIVTTWYRVLTRRVGKHEQSPVLLGQWPWVIDSIRIRCAGSRACFVRPTPAFVGEQ